MRSAAVSGLAALALALTAYLSACDEASEPTEPTEPPTEEQQRILDSRFIYEDGECRWLPPPPAVTELIFTCGKLVLGVEADVRARDLRDLYDAISASLLQDDTDRELGWVVVLVPPRTERAALLRALEDERIRYATVDVVGPAVIG